MAWVLGRSETQVDISPERAGNHSGQDCEQLLARCVGDHHVQPGGFGIVPLIWAFTCTSSGAIYRQWIWNSTSVWGNTGLLNQQLRTPANTRPNPTAAF